MVLAVLLSTTNLFADCPPECTTCVSGMIVGETWTEAGSPYCVEGDILVAGLIIEPGVRVEFLGDYVFEVAGILTVAGTKTEPVVFTRAETNEEGWQGIYFNYSAPGSQLAYAVIEGSINSGINIINSNPIIENCIIQNNTGTNGGGIYISTTTEPAYELIIKNCKVRSNGSNSTIANGGGIHADIQTGLLKLTNCKIDSNTGYSYAWGANCITKGGGIYASGNIKLENCYIINNIVKAVTEHPNYWYDACPRGGGIYFEGGELTMTNCIITNNTWVTGGYHYRSYPQGGGIYIETGTSNIVNCTVAYNDQEGLRRGGGTVDIVNSIFWENILSEIAGTATVTYSDVQDGYTGEGNINYNPIFDTCGPLQIVVGSQCIDAGNPDSQYNDVCFPPSLGTERNDMGAHGGPGACGWPDDCPCDLNYDGKCDMQDWLKFGEEWGHTDCNELGVECECDLNGDGNCDMQDWLCFGEDWGRTDCP